MQSFRPIPSPAAAPCKRLRVGVVRDASDATFRPLHRHTFLSGSGKRDSAIRPQVKNGNAQRPDVDILVVTTHGTYDDPVGALNASHTALTCHYTPTNRQARSAFVSSTLADMDVAPLIGPTDDATYCIADRLQRQWLRTNPLEHTAKPFKWWS